MIVVIMFYQHGYNRYHDVNYISVKMANNGISFSVSSFQTWIKQPWSINEGDSLQIVMIRLLNSTYLQVKCFTNAG